MLMVCLLCCSESVSFILKDRSKLRKIFNELIDLVRSVTGELPSAELFSAVRVFYTSVSSINQEELSYGSRDAPRKALEGLFGPLNASTYGQITSKVNQLVEWKSQFPSSPRKNNQFDKQSEGIHFDSFSFIFCCSVCLSQSYVSFSLTLSLSLSRLSLSTLSNIVAVCR